MAKWVKNTITKDLNIQILGNKSNKKNLNSPPRKEEKGNSLCVCVYVALSLSLLHSFRLQKISINPNYTLSLSLFRLFVLLLQKIFNQPHPSLSPFLHFFTISRDHKSHPTNSLLLSLTNSKKTPHPSYNDNKAIYYNNKRIAHYSSLSSRSPSHFPFLSLQTATKTGALSPSPLLYMQQQKQEQGDTHTVIHLSSSTQLELLHNHGSSSIKGMSIIFIPQTFSSFTTL